MGATVFDEKRIYIEADVAVVAESLLHEMGHFADMSLGWPSGGEAFLGAFEDERAAYAEADERGAGSAREAFAAVFNDICLERGCRERLAPRMFGAVREEMSRLAVQTACQLDGYEAASCMECRSHSATLTPARSFSRRGSG